MSPCPKCGEKGRHVAVWVPWPGVSGPVQVVHECTSRTCDAFRFFEAARDVEAVLVKTAEAFSDRLDARRLKVEWGDAEPADVLVGVL